MLYPKMFKQNVDGSVQTWWMEREGARYRAHSGRMGGAITTSEWTTAHGKNIGRANETTDEGQADAEVLSAYTLKKKGGYRETAESAAELKHFKPMLAYTFDDAKARVTAELEAGGYLIAQPKLDGIRCLASKAGLVSRKGNAIVAVPHISEALDPVFAAYPNIVLDGELYNHQLKEDFPQLVSLVKKQKPTKEDLARSKQMEYHVYDIYDPASPMRPMRERAALVAKLRAGKSIVPVPSARVASFGQIRAVHDQMLSDGYEGTILRFPGAPYQQKRTKDLLKYKDWVEEEYTVLAIHEGEGNRTGMAGYAVLKIGDSTFRANIRGPREYLREILEHRASYVGHDATVIHAPLTPAGKPRFPRVKVFYGKKRDV